MTSRYRWSASGSGLGAARPSAQSAQRNSGARPFMTN